MRWTFVVAYYNEADYLERTLRSLAAQELKPFRLLLIDNGSTDASPAIARRLGAEMAGVEVVHLAEERPGKIFALEAAMPRLATPFVAFGDADTFYPPHYLRTADEAFTRGGETVVAAMAVDLRPPLHGWRARAKRFHNQLVYRLWPNQTHTGGYGQCFRTNALKAAGGYSHAIWPYVLMDHEIMQRMLKQGRAVYPADLWCMPSPRRANRSRVRWSIPERLLYHFTPASTKDWFFYRFLGPRLARRRLGHLNLREKSWLTESKTS